MLEDMLKNTIDGIKGVIDGDEVLGKPILLADGSLVMPISKVSYGFVVGDGEYGTLKDKNVGYPKTGVGGGGMSVTPLGFLVLGRDKRYISVDDAEKQNKWLELIKAALAVMKKD